MKTSTLFISFGLVVTGGGFYLTSDDHGFVGFWTILAGCVITCLGFMTREGE